MSHLAASRACRRLAPINIPAAQLQVLARVEETRTCLSGRGLHPHGGAQFLNRSGSPIGPRGELIVANAFLAFYENPAQAKLGALGIEANATSIGGTVEQHGTVALIWIHRPSPAERTAVTTCVPS